MLIGPAGISGIFISEIVEGIIFVAPNKSDNSSTISPMLSERDANSINLVPSWVNMPGLFGYAKKATGLLAPITMIVSKSFKILTALSTT